MWQGVEEEGRGQDKGNAGTWDMKMDMVMDTGTFKTYAAHDEVLCQIRREHVCGKRAAHLFRLDLWGL